MNHKLRTTIDWLQLPYNILNMFVFKRKLWDEKSLELFTNGFENTKWRRDSKPFKIIRFLLKLKLKK